MSPTRRRTGAPIDPDRRRPIKDAADQYTRWLGIVGGIVVTLVTGGVLTAAQGSAITGLLGLIPGVCTAVATIATAFGIRRHAEPNVTPLSDPRDAKMRPLVAVEPGSRLVPKDERPDNLTGTAARVGRRRVDDRSARRRGDGSPDPYTAGALGAFGTALAVPYTDPAPGRDCPPAAPTDSSGYTGGGGSGSGDVGGGGSCGGDSGGGGGM